MKKFLFIALLALSLSAKAQTLVLNTEVRDHIAALVMNTTGKVVDSIKPVQFTMNTGYIAREPNKLFYSKVIINCAGSDNWDPGFSSNGFVSCSITAFNVKSWVCHRIYEYVNRIGNDTYGNPKHALVAKVTDDVNYYMFDQVDVVGLTGLHYGVVTFIGFVVYVH